MTDSDSIAFYEKMHNMRNKLKRLGIYDDPEKATMWEKKFDQWREAFSLPPTGDVR